MEEFLVLEKRCINIRYIIQIIELKKDEFDNHGFKIDQNCYRIEYKKDATCYFDIKEETNDYLRIKEFFIKLNVR